MIFHRKADIKVLVPAGVGIKFCQHFWHIGAEPGGHKNVFNQILLFQLLFFTLVCCNSNADSFPQNEIWQAISP